MPLLVRKYALLAKTETTYGQDASPTSANGILVENLDIRPMYDVLERGNVALADISKPAHLIGQHWIEISFDVEVRGAGDAANPDTVPDWGPLVEACKFSETVNTGSDVTYKPESGDDESVTIYAYKDGLVFKAVGCVGTFSIDGEVGQPAKFHFTFHGKLSAVADESLPSITFQNMTPPVVLGATFTYDDWDAIISRFSINMNNTIAPRRDVTDSTGIKGFWISDRNPEGGIDPEAVNVATRDVWTKIKQVNQGAFNLVIGSSAGNKVTINCPKCAKKSIAFGDREGIATFDLTFGIYRNSGDDEITIKTE